MSTHPDLGDKAPEITLSFSSDFWVGKKAVEFKNAIKIFFKSVSDFTRGRGGLG